MRVRPLGNNLIVKKQTDEKVGDFIVPFGEEELNRGEIIAVGKGCTEELKRGNKVMYAKFAENQIGEYLLISENDILGVYEN